MTTTSLKSGLIAFSLLAFSAVLASAQTSVSDVDNEARNAYQEICTTPAPGFANTCEIPVPAGMRLAARWFAATCFLGEVTTVRDIQLFLPLSSQKTEPTLIIGTHFKLSRVHSNQYFISQPLYGHADENPTVVISHEGFLPQCVFEIRGFLVKKP